MEGPIVVLVNFDSPQKLHRFTCPYTLRDAASPTWRAYSNETKARQCVDGDLTWCSICGQNVDDLIYDVRPESQERFAELVNECLDYWAEELWTSVKNPDRADGT